MKALMSTFQRWWSTIACDLEDESCRRPLCWQPSRRLRRCEHGHESLLRDLCRKPYACQLLTSGQKRVLNGDVRCRRVSGLSSLSIKIPAAHFRARVLADG